MKAIKRSHATKKVMLMNREIYLADLSGERIDKWLISQNCELSRSLIQKLLDDGSITVNGKSVNKNYKIRQNDEIVVTIPDPVQLDAVAQNIPIDIIYEDDDLLVVNKPKGMVVHPAHGNADNTLVNALLYHCDGRLSSINGVIRPGIVHRIDKNTSGLLIVAKNDNSHIHLASQIKEHSFTREYYAVVVGVLPDRDGTIDAPIGRDKNDRKRMTVTTQNSKNAITHYQTLDVKENHSLVKFRLETGRTHQIRVHSSYKGRPIYGDDVYGKAVKDIEGQCLHAGKIGFVHPVKNEYMEFISDLPDYFIKICNKYKLDFSQI